ncbi:MAG: pyridoxal-phosphate dependent enzyme [Cyclobacteriaceae bacterium]
MLAYRKTPLIELKSDLLQATDISLWMKREELNHAEISGNKWWKLKYNLQEAKAKGFHTILTFGGAYSNHLYATAAAAKEEGLKSIGVVRGEEQVDNSTLRFAESKGMTLHFVSREVYRTKASEAYIESLQKRFGPFYLIPEGGTNVHAIRGVEEWADSLATEMKFNHLCLPVGTGGTIAGMINRLSDKTIIGFSSLKGGGFLQGEVKKWLIHRSSNWHLETAYHFGGYGKVTKTLLDFMQQFETTYQIPLDPIYTAKMMYGLFDMIKQGRFERGSTILALHTGGLQGRAGFNF